MEVIEQTQGSVLVVALKGRLDAASSGAVQDRIVAVIDGGARQLVLDLAGLDYVSSAGLRVLLVAAKKMKPAGGKLCLSGLQPSIKEIFDIAGFTGMFILAPGLSEAVAAVQ